MSLDGDFARLDRLIAGVNDLAAQAFRRRVLEAARPVVSDLVRAEFQLSRGPTGTAWRRLKQPRPRGRPNKGGPLYDSGDLREQASSPVVLGDALVIAIRHPGALVHLYGRRAPSMSRDARGRFRSHGKTPARPYLPLRALPTPWARGLATAATTALRAEFR